MDAEKLLLDAIKAVEENPDLFYIDEYGLITPKEGYTGDTSFFDMQHRIAKQDKIKRTLFK